MPPPRPPVRPGRTPAIVISTLVAIGVSGALVWSVVRFASENPEKANLGDPVFQVGRAERLAGEIDDDGPFLFQDPLSLGRGRNLYIQHLGNDPEAGWLAVEARLPDEPGCAVTWDRARRAFIDCHGARHRADGGDLITYRGKVTDGQVSVDLRSRATTTAGAGDQPGP